MLITYKAAPGSTSLEDSPGNVTLGEEADRFQIRLYLENGSFI